MDDLDAHLLTEIIVRARPSVHWLCAASCISRKWKQACYSPVLWQNLEIDGGVWGNLYGAGLHDIASRCRNLKSLKMFNVHIMERPNPWMHHCLEQLLEASGGSLETLSLAVEWELPFTDKLLSIVGRCCPNLTRFKLSAMNYFMTDAALAMFLRACPRVLHFKCYVRSASPIHAPGDTILWQISKKWPDLQSLEVNGNHVSENGVFGLQDCKKLKRLTFHGYNRGVFDRAKSTADGELAIFDSLEEVGFTYQLPTAAELRRLMRMCPRLTKLTFATTEGDLHAGALVSIAQQEFPTLDVRLQILPANPTQYPIVDIAAGLGCNIDKY